MSVPPKGYSAARIDCVQALRALAAVAVVTTHIPLNAFTNGLWGVDLFFIISGFIMCYVTEVSGRYFFLKRLIRIVPLYWGGTLGVFLIALIMPHLLNTTSANSLDLFRSLAFIPFQKGDIVVPVLFPGWTLNYEMFFYALFAISMRISHRHRAPICSALILAVAGCGQIVAFDSVILHFFSQPIIIEFVLGMACYTLLKPTLQQTVPYRARSRVLWVLLGTTLIILMPLASISFPHENRVITWGLLAAGAFFCLVRGLADIKLPRPIVLLGDASYSLYLFHPYIIQSVNKALSPFDAQTGTSYVTACAVTVLCCAVSVWIYRYAERPVTRYLRARFLGGA